MNDTTYNLGRLIQLIHHYHERFAPLPPDQQAFLLFIATTAYNLYQNVQTMATVSAESDLCFRSPLNMAIETLSLEENTGLELQYLKKLKEKLEKDAEAEAHRLEALKKEATRSPATPTTRIILPIKRRLLSDTNISIKDPYIQKKVGAYGRTIQARITYLNSALQEPFAALDYEQRRAIEDPRYSAFLEEALHCFCSINANLSYLSPTHPKKHFNRLLKQLKAMHYLVTGLGGEFQLGSQTVDPLLGAAKQRLGWETTQNDSGLVQAWMEQGGKKGTWLRTVVSSSLYSAVSQFVNSFKGCHAFKKQFVFPSAAMYPLLKEIKPNRSYHVVLDSSHPDNKTQRVIGLRKVQKNHTLCFEVYLPSFGSIYLPNEKKATDFLTLFVCLQGRLFAEDNFWADRLLTYTGTAVPFNNDLKTINYETLAKNDAVFFALITTMVEKVKALKNDDFKKKQVKQTFLDAFTLIIDNVSNPQTLEKIKSFLKQPEHTFLTDRTFTQFNIATSCFNVIARQERILVGELPSYTPQTLATPRLFTPFKNTQNSAGGFFRKYLPTFSWVHTPVKKVKVV